MRAFLMFNCLKCVSLKHWKVEVLVLLFFDLTFLNDQINKF